MLDRILIGSSAEPSDPDFENVTLLLHGDGSNGAQNNTFIDSSTNNFTITRNGNTTQGSFSPYGSNWSNYFDGTGDYLSIADNAAFDFGSGDFTIEAWVNFSTSTSGVDYPIVVQGTNAFTSNASFLFGRHNTNKLRFIFTDDGTGSSGYKIVDSTNNFLPTTGVWYHLAVTRSGSTFRLFVDGTQVGSNTYSQSIYNGTRPITIGADDGASVALNGYISNVRILKGTALYTAAFTPSTTPLTAITNTSLLTCADNRFRDGSTNNFTITRNGDVKVTNFAPFAPSSAYSTTTNGGSAYFDGTGDYLTSTSADTANAMGTGDWTVEGWVYRTSSASDMMIFDTVGVSAGSADYIRIFLNAAGTISLYRYSTAVTTTTSSIPVGTWGHIAVVRQSGSVKIYINGTQGNTTYTDTGVNYTCSASRPVIGINGFDNSSNPFSGYISNIRAVKGTAVYTANFTPTTTPLTAITNTSLLLNATNAAIFDNSMKNDLETVGNAQISTSVKKFGTGSMAFDGSGDYLKLTGGPHFDFGTGDFTIEFWFNGTSVASGSLIDFRPYLTHGFYPTIYLDTGTVRFYTNLADRIVSGSISTSTWYHIALARSGTSTRLFINGTQAGSTYTDSNNYGSSSIPVICASSHHLDGTGAVNGFVDDFRITKGVARYTANFTAPTAPFPNK